MPLRYASYSPRLWIQLPLAAVVIVAVSLWESLECWHAMIGCWRPWDVGWPRWGTLFGNLLLGPFAFYASALQVYRGPDATTVIGYTMLGLPILLSPWGCLVLRRRGPVAIATGTFLWLLGGHDWSISMWV